MHSSSTASGLRVRHLASAKARQTAPLPPIAPATSRGALERRAAEDLATADTDMKVERHRYAKFVLQEAQRYGHCASTELFVMTMLNGLAAQHEVPPQTRAAAASWGMRLLCEGRRQSLMEALVAALFPAIYYNYDEQQLDCAPAAVQSLLGDPNLVRDNPSLSHVMYMQKLPSGHAKIAALTERLQCSLDTSTVWSRFATGLILHARWLCKRQVFMAWRLHVRYRRADALLRRSVVRRHERLVRVSRLRAVFFQWKAHVEMSRSEYLTERLHEAAFQLEGAKERFELQCLHAERLQKSHNDRLAELRAVTKERDALYQRVEELSATIAQREGEYEERLAARMRETLALLQRQRRTIEMAVTTRFDAAAVTTPWLDFSNPNPNPTTDSNSNTDSNSAPGHLLLLRWCNSILPSAPGKRRMTVANFAKDFENGQAFNVLLCHVYPSVRLRPLATPPKNGIDLRNRLGRLCTIVRNETALTTALDPDDFTFRREDKIAVAVAELFMYHVDKDAATQARNALAFLKTFPATHDSNSKDDNNNDDNKTGNKADNEGDSDKDKEDDNEKDKEDDNEKDNEGDNDKDKGDDNEKDKEDDNEKGNEGVSDKDNEDDNECIIVESNKDDSSDNENAMDTKDGNNNDITKADNESLDVTVVEEAGDGAGAIAPHAMRRKECISHSSADARVVPVAEAEALPPPPPDEAALRQSILAWDSELRSWDTALRACVVRDEALQRCRVAIARESAHLFRQRAKGEPVYTVTPWSAKRYITVSSSLINVMRAQLRTANVPLLKSALREDLYALLQRHLPNFTRIFHAYAGEDTHEMSEVQFWRFVEECGVLVKPLTASEVAQIFDEVTSPQLVALMRSNAKDDAAQQRVAEVMQDEVYVRYMRAVHFAEILVRMAVVRFSRSPLYAAECFLAGLQLPEKAPAHTLRFYEREPQEVIIYFQQDLSRIFFFYMRSQINASVGGRSTKFQGYGRYMAHMDEKTYLCIFADCDFLFSAEKDKNNTGFQRRVRFISEDEVSLVFNSTQRRIPALPQGELCFSLFLESLGIMCVYWCPDVTVHFSRKLAGFIACLIEKLTVVHEATTLILAKPPKVSLDCDGPIKLRSA